MSKFTIFAMLCMAAAGNVSAHVYKSVGADGKVMYSDHPSDQNNVSVSIIKADIVQVVPMAAGEASSAPVTQRLAAMADTGADAGSKDGTAPKKVCNKMVNVVVGPNGEILRILPAKSVLSAFKVN